MDAPAPAIQALKRSARTGRINMHKGSLTRWTQWTNLSMPSDTGILNEPWEVFHQ